MSSTDTRSQSREQAALVSTQGAEAPKRDLIRSLQRGLAILSFVAGRQAPPTARDISVALGLNIATCYHLLNTLEHDGFLARNSERRFILGSRIGELHDAFEAQLAPDPNLLEALEQLNLRTGETSYLGIWQRDEVVSVAVREGRRSVSVRASYLGYRLHAHARALGRALLAYRDDAFLETFIDDGELEKLTERTTTDPALLRRALADVRALGVAVEREEFTSGVCCAGAPILGADGEPVAALSVSVPKARFDTEGEAIIEALRDVAEQASARLRLHGSSTRQ